MVDVPHRLSPEIVIRLALILALWVAPAAAQDLREIAAELADHPAVPGAVVAVVTPGSASYAFAGKRKTLNGDAIERSDRWHVGSLTKAMTATLAARMVEKGQISWDTTIGELISPAGNHGAATLLDLLTHRSGLPANLPGPVSQNAPSREFYVRAGLRMPVARQRRGEFRYSNVGYVTAGHMLEKAGGAPWEELVGREVFAPLGMTGAGFGPPDLNFGHRAGPKAVPPGPGADNAAVMAPAGTVHVQVEDMLAFLATHLAWDQAYLSLDSWERLHTTVEGADHTPGWVVDGEGRLVHSGSNTLWWAVMEVDHAAGRALFVAVNAGDQRGVRGPVLRAVRALRGEDEG